MPNSKRLLALDVFRGLTMALMILVNTPGSWAYVYPPFRHAEWHGLTLTDLVFPFFLYIVGVSLYLVQRRRPLHLRRIWRRAFRLVLIGWLLRAFPFTEIRPSHFRFMGVLPRIGLAYGLSATMVKYMSRRQLIVAMAVLLAGYWGVLVYYGQGAPYALETNAVRRLDLWLFGAGHLWHGKEIAFDPEGILSTFPAVVTVLLGYFSGIWIREGRAGRDLMVWGTALVGAGSLWGVVFPVNKSLWTSSYVLVTGGLAMWLLALLWWVLEVRQWRRWSRPFEIFGRNAITGFVLSILWAKMLLKIKWTTPDGVRHSAYRWLYKQVFVPVFGQMNGSLAFALFSVVVVWVVLWYLWRRRIFLRV